MDVFIHLLTHSRSTFGAHTNFQTFSYVLEINNRQDRVDICLYEIYSLGERENK